jgi:SAM-dependent methyltransferase
MTDQHTVALAGTPAAAAATAGDALQSLIRRLEAAEGRLASALAELDALRRRLAARPYSAGDPYGALGDLSVPMGFGPDPLAEEPPPAWSEPSGFADVFRGPVELITDRQRVYLPMLRGREPVVDLGCGRGEMLALLAAEGVAFSGVDTDANCVARCRRLGLDAVEQDALEFLQATPVGSVGAVFSAQFIEHLSAAEARRMLELSARALRPGGLLIVETVNPEAHEAFKTFHVDPTHQCLLFPQVLLHMCHRAGFAAGRVFYPLGGGFVQDVYDRVGEYAVVARTAGAPAAVPCATDEEEVR